MTVQKFQNKVTNLILSSDKNTFQSKEKLYLFLNKMLFEIFKLSKLKFYLPWSQVHNTIKSKFNHQVQCKISAF